MPLQLPLPETALHLYRHLLREITYLPQVIRPRISERVELMFRRHRTDQDPARRLKKGAQKLRLLRAAVAGDRTRLEHVVSVAFGRRGFRRRQLLADFLKPEPPADTAALEKLLDQASAGAGGGSSAPRKTDWLDKWDSDKLLELLKAQSNAGGLNRNDRRISSYKLDPSVKVPETNAWGRPFPAKPARTKLKKWWVSMSEKTLPPLPRGEWDLLGSLARGELDSGWEVVPRRPVAQGAGAEEERARLHAQMWDMERYLLMTTRWADRRSSRKHILLSGVPQQNNEFGHVGGAGAGTGVGPKLGPRAMKRLYQRVWQEAPLMEPRSGAARKWNVKYGERPRRLRRALDPHTIIFHGVDAQGVPLKAT